MRAELNADYSRCAGKWQAHGPRAAVELAVQVDKNGCGEHFGRAAFAAWKQLPSRRRRKRREQDELVP